MAVNRVRRNGSYAPLSAHYYKDDAIGEAGEKAEVLYTRGLAFCADVLSDGFISTRQLQIIGIGLSGLANRAAALVRVGLWEKVDGGWRVASWLKWNRSKAEIDSMMNADAGRKGKPPNSERNPNGIPPDSDPSPNGFQSSRNARAHPPPPVVSSANTTATSNGPPPPGGPPTDEEVADLVDHIRTIRPEWSATSIQRALNHLDVQQRPWSVVVSAMVLVAQDPDSSVPGRLRNDGPWWSEAAGAARPAAREQRGFGPQCGECDQNRQVETPAGMKRCPRCHPLRATG